MQAQGRPTANQDTMRDRSNKLQTGWVVGMLVHRLIVPSCVPPARGVIALMRRLMLRQTICILTTGNMNTPTTRLLKTPSNLHTGMIHKGPIKCTRCLVAYVYLPLHVLYGYHHLHRLTNRSTINDNQTMTYRAGIHVKTPALRALL